MYKKERNFAKTKLHKNYPAEGNFDRRGQMDKIGMKYAQNTYANGFSNEFAEERMNQKTERMKHSEEELFNQRKQEEKTFASDIENDIWSDHVNDEDIELEMEMNRINNTDTLADQKKEMYKKVAKIEKGESPLNASLKNNPKIIDFIRSGNIQTALKLISKKFGIVNVEPLKPIIKNIYISTYAYVTPVQNCVPLKICLLTNKENCNNTYITKQFLLNQLKKAHKLVSYGKFALALNLFRSVLYHIIFIDSTSMEKELMEFLNGCVNYILAMRLEDERAKTEAENPGRSLELMAYFTCCSIENPHLYLVLRRGMGIAWKSKNYVTAGSFAKRLINGNFENIQGAEKELIKAKKILSMCEHKSTEQYNIDYDPNDYDNMRICCVSLKRMKPNENSISCPLCLSVAKPEYASLVCTNCQIAKLGVKALGFDFVMKRA